MSGQISNPQYLIIVTLVDGQNFSIPDGSPDKVEATVFAEARFANESVLRSDPVRLSNSNPEFLTELAWQLDKKTLHHLRVERKAIKIQVFLQTKERKRKNTSQSNVNQLNQDQPERTGSHSSKTDNDVNGDNLNGTNKIELIGYTVMNIRSAQECEVPKYQWLPLLNPKFRKSCYNRPEIQLALKLSRVDNDVSQTGTSKSQQNILKKVAEITSSINSECHASNPSDDTCDNSLNDDTSRLYRTCLDLPETALNESINGIGAEATERDEIIENDIQIHCRDGDFFIFDIRNFGKFTIFDCDQRYRVKVRIPFISDLDLLLVDENDRVDKYNFTINLFGSLTKMRSFDKLTNEDTNEIHLNVFTTDSGILSTYFRLNPTLVIRFHQEESGRVLGLANIQVDQLCTIESKRRSVEGIFALQPINDSLEIPSRLQPTIGVSVVLEKVDDDKNGLSNFASNFSLVDDSNESVFKSFNDTHQITTEDINDEELAPVASSYVISPEINQHINHHSMDRTHKVEKKITATADSKFDNREHHFSFTIDLKNFSYNQNQRLIPTLRELNVRYSYPFFGYKDTITTDASIPISPTTSIIVSGFCEFNFATTYESLIAALNEIPLQLDILTNEQSPRRSVSNGVCEFVERVVATCELRLAEILNINDLNGNTLEESLNKTISAPIYNLEGEYNGRLEVYLCLKDLGLPSLNSKEEQYKSELPNDLDRLNTQSNEQQSESKPKPMINLKETYRSVDTKINDIPSRAPRKIDSDEKSPLNDLIDQTRASIEEWQEKTYIQLSEELKTRETERWRQIQQRYESRDSKREQELKDKLRDLNNLEKRFKKSLMAIDSLEKMLRTGFEQLKSKNSDLDQRLEIIDEKISKALEGIKISHDGKQLELEPLEDHGQGGDEIEVAPDIVSTEVIGTQTSAQMILKSPTIGPANSRNRCTQTSLLQSPKRQSQQPVGQLIAPAKKLSFFASKLSRSSEGSLVVNPLRNRALSSNQVTSNGLIRANSNTKMASGFTVIEVGAIKSDNSNPSRALTKPMSSRPMTASCTIKLNGNSSNNDNNDNMGNLQKSSEGDIRTVPSSSSGRIARLRSSGQIPKVR